MQSGWILLPLALAATASADPSTTTPSPEAPGHPNPTRAPIPAPRNDATPQPGANEWASALAEGRRHLALDRDALRALFLGPPRLCGNPQEWPNEYRSRNWPAAAAALPALDQARENIAARPASARQRFLTNFFRGLALEHNGRDFEALRSLRSALDAYVQARRERTVPPPGVTRSWEDYPGSWWSLGKAGGAPGFEDLVAFTYLLGSPANKRDLDLRLTAHRSLAATAELVLGSNHPFLAECLLPVAHLQAEGGHRAGLAVTLRSILRIYEADDENFLEDRLQLREDLATRVADAGAPELRREFLVDQADRARERFGPTSLFATLAAKQLVDALSVDTPLEGDLGRRLAKARLKRRFRPRHVPTLGTLSGPVRAALKTGLDRASWLWDRSLSVRLSRLLDDSSSLPATAAISDLAVAVDEFTDRGLYAPAATLAKARLNLIDGLRHLSGYGAIRPDAVRYAALVSYRSLLLELGRDTEAMAVGRRVRELELFQAWAKDTGPDSAASGA